MGPVRYRRRAYRRAMSTDDMTPDEKRHDQLTRAPGSDESDAAPRITTEDRGDGVTRIDVADTAKVRPGRSDEES